MGSLYAASPLYETLQPKTGTEASKGRVHFYMESQANGLRREGQTQVNKR